MYQRYAAVQQVLSLGHRCVSVVPELLLLSDPLPLLAHHPADVSVMSTALGDEAMAYGKSDRKPGQAYGMFCGMLTWPAAVACLLHTAHTRDLSWVM